MLGIWQKLYLLLFLTILVESCGVKPRDDDWGTEITECRTTTSTNGSANCRDIPDTVYNGIYVNCSYAGLTSVPADLGSNVTSLVLSVNNITILCNGCLHNMTQLRFLDVSFNPLRRIEIGAFEGLNSLLSLLINGHKVIYSEQNFPSGLFQPLVALENLSLIGDYGIGTGNPTADRVLGPLKNLVNLVIDSGPETVFSSNVSKLSSLRRISIHGMYSITNETFRAFSNLSVIYLDIVRYGTSTFEVGGLLPFPDLTTFVINDIRRRGTVLAILESLKLQGNKSMAEITIRNDDNNRLPLEGGVTLSFKTFAPICVKKLDLSNLNLDIIDPITLFLPPTSPFIRCIKHLILKNNVITGSVPLYLVYLVLPLTQIESYDRPMSFANQALGGNVNPTGHQKRRRKHSMAFPILVPKSLKYINSAGLPYRPRQVVNMSLFNTQNLEYLNVSYCGLFGFNTIIIDGLQSLKVLDVSGNDLSDLHPSIFDTFPNLRTLRVSDAYLDNLFMISHGKRLFQSLSQLQHIDLSYNKFVHLSKDIFQPLISLEYLNLANNNFVTLPELISLQRLVFVHVQFNALTTLDTDYRAMLDKIGNRNKEFGLSLTGNTLSCNCGAHEFLVWLAETRINLDGRDYTCMNASGQFSTTATIYRKWNIYNRQCNAPFWLSVATGGLGVMLLSLIIAFVLLKNKMKVIVFIQTLLGRFVHQKTRQEFQQDGVIIYADSIYQWVCQDLINELEGKRKLRLYVRDRDEPLGACEAECIYNAMKTSWKLVIILTEDFLKTELSLFIMSACLTLMKLTTPNRVILLVDSKVQIPSNIAFYLEAVVEENILYIDFQDGFSERFWNRLYNLILGETMSTW